MVGLESMEARKPEGERMSCLASRMLGYLEALFFLSVHRVHGGHDGDELDGGERFVRLLPDPAVREHLLDYFDDLPLCEAISDFRQATDVQGVGEHTSVAENDLFPQNCQHPRQWERWRTKLWQSQQQQPRSPLRTQSHQERNPQRNPPQLVCNSNEQTVE